MTDISQISQFPIKVNDLLFTLDHFLRNIQKMFFLIMLLKLAILLENIKLIVNNKSVKMISLFCFFLSLQTLLLQQSIAYTFLAHCFNTSMFSCTSINLTRVSYFNWFFKKKRLYII